MTQHVTASTHSKRHTHDLIITRGDENLVHDVIILPDLFSDHNVVTCKLDLPKPLASKTYVTYRSTKSLTADVLDDVLPKVPYVRDSKSPVTVDLTILVIKYNTALEKICNDLAPMKSRWITHRPHATWYNNDLCLNKRIKWRVERMFRKTGLEVNKKIFAEACNKYQRQLEFHKSSYYKSKIERAGKNKLFRMSTNCFDLAAQPFLPIHLWTYWSKISTTSLSGRSGLRNYWSYDLGGKTRVLLWFLKTGTVLVQILPWKPSAINSYWRSSFHSLWSALWCPTGVCTRTITFRPIYRPSSRCNCSP